ncbi:MAG: tandem-95 repeat protein, partial [Pseudobdellovibrionaceae bacterium]
MKTRMTGRFIVIIIVLFFLGCKNPFGGDDSSKISLFFQPNQNKAPIAKDDTLSTNKNIAVSNQLQATDANGDALTFSIVTQPTLGSIQLSATGSYTYTPTTNAIGSDSITFEAYDGNLKSNLATVAITINNTAATPVGNNITPADIAEDVQSGTITLSYSDVDGDLATSCSITTLTNITETQACACTSGVCTVKVTGTANYNGAASFSYTVTTLAEVSNVATATLNITAVNDAPTISAISDISTSFTTAKQVSFTISDDSALSCSTSLAFISNNTTLLSHSNIAWSGTAPNCTATLTPNPHREGTSSLTIRATDSSGASTDRSFTLTVTPPHPNALKL